MSNRHQEYKNEMFSERRKVEQEGYARELDRAAGLLTKVLPIGKCKSIGRLEVAAAVEELVLMYDREKAARELLLSYTRGG